MEKKEYIKPETEVVELELESLLLSASNKVDISDEPTDEGAWMSNGRRGKWGDLWCQGEE